MAGKELAGVQGVSALDGLRANERLVNLLAGWRRIAMRQSQDEGHSWAEIGAALDMSKRAPGVSTSGPSRRRRSTSRISSLLPSDQSLLAAPPARRMTHTCSSAGCARLATDGDTSPTATRSSPACRGRARTDRTRRQTRPSRRHWTSYNASWAHTLYPP